MEQTVILNNREIKAYDYKDESADKKKISFRFKVRSGQEYHDITVLLYENNFKVEVPESNLSFQGTITNYFSSVTNLYKENETGEFTLELTEK